MRAAPVETIRFAFLVAFLALASCAAALAKTVGLDAIDHTPSASLAIADSVFTHSGDAINAASRPSCLQRCRVASQWQVKNGQVVPSLRKKGFFIVKTTSNVCREVHTTTRPGRCHDRGVCRTGTSGKYVIKCQDQVDCNAPEPTPGFAASSHVSELGSGASEFLDDATDSESPALNGHAERLGNRRKRHGAKHSVTGGQVCQKSCIICVKSCEGLYKLCRCSKPSH
jgi:hypothetical protein